MSAKNDCKNYNKNIFCFTLLIVFINYMMYYITVAALSRLWATLLYNGRKWELHLIRVQ